MAFHLIRYYLIRYTAVQATHHLHTPQYYKYINKIVLILMAIVGVRSSAAHAHYLLSGAGSNPGLSNLSSVLSPTHCITSLSYLVLRFSAQFNSIQRWVNVQYWQKSYSFKYILKFILKYCTVHLIKTSICIVWIGWFYITFKFIMSHSI